MTDDELVVDDFTENECALAQLLKRKSCLISWDGDDHDGIRDYWYKLSARKLIAEGVRLESPHA